MNLERRRLITALNGVLEAKYNALIDAQLGVDTFGFAVKKPCGNCPFRKGAELHEGMLKDSVKLFNAMDNGQMLFSCHKTDPRSDDPKAKLVNGKPQHCAGALVFQRNIGELRNNRSLNWAEFRGMISLRRIRKSAAVFQSKQEFLLHYLRLYKAKNPDKLKELDLYG